MKCKIAYAVEDLLFEKFILKLTININSRKYYTNRVIKKKSTFSKEDFNSIVALACLKACLDDPNNLPRLEGEEANKRVILVAYEYGYLIKKIKLEEFDPSDTKLQDSILSRGYDFADKHDLNYKDMYVMNLGCFRKGYIEKKIGNKDKLTVEIKDIDQYYGEEPNNETLVCSLV